MNKWDKAFRKICFIIALLPAAGCAEDPSKQNSGFFPAQSFVSIPEETKTIEDAVEEENIEQENEMRLLVNETLLTVKWEENEAVTALSRLVQEGPLTISMEQYGGFEQVGKLPRNITANDEQMVTEPGDIVLYSGNSLVIFYGSNTWAYTKLGHIEGVSAKELESILSDDRITATLSLLEE